MGPGLLETRDEVEALAELALAPGELLEDLLVGLEGLRHVLAVAVGEVAPRVGLDEGHAHLEDHLEELPDGVVAGRRRDGRVREVAEDVVELLVRGLKGCGK